MTPPELLFTTICHKNYSLPLGLIQPSSPTKELHGQANVRLLSKTNSLLNTQNDQIERILEIPTKIAQLNSRCCLSTGFELCRMQAR